MIKIIAFFNVWFFSMVAIFSPKEEAKTNLDENMPMCNTSMVESIEQWTKLPSSPVYSSVPSGTGTIAIDSTKAYTMPLLAQTPKGEILLSWTEKDEQGLTSFCLAFSKDKGKTFGDKKVIFSSKGIGNSRLMRAKVLAKKDGSLVALFTNRPDVPGGAPAGGRGGRTADLVYCLSKDAGTTWTSPQNVDSDPAKAMRGFFDAIVLPNDEIAVFYLKDVANSTKHEERDLRMVLSKNGVFQPERLIDPVVCDCCNINLLVDANGALHVYYRDNNDDIRDIAKITSTDNGVTFSKPQILHNDGWKINGCPHSGAISSSYGKGALVAWFSGAESESGFRLVTQEGKKLFVLSDASVKNPWIMAGAKQAVMIWEQSQADSKNQLVFRKINGDKVSETVAVDGSVNALNSTGLMLDNQLLLAHEVKGEKKNSLKITTVAL
ncbi:MAG: sialidase family protein [Haliscomenobacter sp.]|uniref:sialidase family protein n=1 Tax=Haliscomenobacter sp. TaxID=2717303 RepID=UPI0029BAA473|nr:sialidase family protein [Haliscomenobacter sp.]MDX2071536.1 sialidase family protein [Haliscomenobacter sp.]